MPRQPRLNRSTPATAARSLRLEPLEDRRVLSVTLEMLTDVGSTPHYGDSNPSGFVQVGDLTYFSTRPSSFDPQQTWVTNGTTNATRLLSEVLPGNLSVGGVVGNVAGKLYFSVMDPIPVRSSLWQWAGFDSEPTPVLSADGGRVAAVTSLTEVNGVWYFGGGSTGSDLWRTDGTQAGTTRVKTIRSDGFAWNTQLMFNVGGTLFFSANDGTHGNELWKSDGTEEGTVLVKDVNPGSGSGAWLQSADKMAAVVGDILYFSGTDQTTGSELWRSDGTTEGTFRVKELASGANGSNPKYLTNIGGALYFTTSLSDVGEYLLWKSDGTEAGTTAIPFGASSPFDLTELNGALYFGASGGLWRSDGTMTGTRQIGRSGSQNFALTIPSPQPGSSLHRDNIVNFNGTLYFVGGNSGGSGLWKLTDEEVNATYVLGDNSPLPPASQIVNALQHLTVVDDKLYFAGRSSSYGIEPWISDGTVAGTRMLKDVTGMSTGSGTGWLANVDGTLRFIGNTGLSSLTPPRGWWTTDGTIAGTTSYAAVPGKVNGYSVLGSAAGLTFFKSTSSLGDNDWELWRTDGTTAGTFRVKDIRPGVEGAFGDGRVEATEVNGILYFRANDGVHGSEIWRTDGTDAGTYLLADLNPGPAGSNPNGKRTLANVSGTLYFSSTDGNALTGLWKSDGTGTAASLVRRFNSVPADNLINVGGILYFSAGQGFDGNELWRSDGTEAGTTLVKNINGTGDGLSRTYPPQFTNVGGTLFFLANNGIAGYELWRSDGTEAGTMLVKDIRLDGDGMAPFRDARLTVVGSMVYFYANDGTHGLELWKSDGTETGTTLIRDIRRGSSSSDIGVIANPVNVGGILYFGASDAVNGAELWRSDGTEAGTYMVRNINAVFSGLGGSDPNWLTNVNGRLYFTANDGTHGTELWMLSPDPSAMAAGDYDQNGVTDGADFLKWQRSFGSSDVTNDGDGDGVVGLGDLEAWKQSFGTPVSAAAVSDRAAVAALVAEEEENVEAPAFGGEPQAAIGGDVRQASRRETAARDALFAAGDLSHFFAAGEDDFAEASWRRRRDIRGR